MKITHVGSLPFLNPKEAIDYTFKWDIPVLFTLPKLDPSQFMGEDLAFYLDIREASIGELKLDKKYYQSTKKIIPKYLDDFLRAKEENEIHPLKFQMIGPVTFYEMINNKKKINFFDLVEFMQEKYCKLCESLAQYGELIFVLDEPMLDYNYEFYSSREGLLLLKTLEESAEVFIHSCAKLHLERTQNYTHYLNIDMTLYDKNDQNLDQIIFPGGESLPYAKYLSPSCGLALKKVNECLDILAELRSRVGRSVK